MPGFSTALYRPSVQNFVGGLEGDAGGAANYLGAFAKSQGEIDPDTGWNSLGDWLINNGTYWNDRADDVQQQFGTLNRYQNEGILQRLTDTDYLTDSRGLMADVFNGAGSSVPFIVTGALTPEIGIGGALARGAGGLLERMGMSTAGRAVASDLVQSGANDFARYALTGGPLEAAINAGGIYDDLKNQGLSDSEIFGKMNSMIGEELPVDMLTSGLYGAVLGGNTFSRLGQGGWKRAIAANALNTPADMLGEYMQEMTQQQLQNKYSGKPYGTFWNPTEDEMQAGRAAAMGTLPMGMFGSARGVRNSRRAAMAAEDGGSVTGPEPVTPPAVPDPDVDPVEAAQLTGKNDDVPTADGIDVTNLDPQQYTQWYGDKLKSQGIDVPDATITVQTPKAQQTSGAGSNATSGAPSYDASALEGAPQYTISDEVSSTNVTPLTDQKMRLLDSAYYNKYGQHLYITSMKRNGNPDESWHNSGQAFDTADDNLANNKEARDWLVSEGEKLGLTPLDEYENPSAHATGGHIHFSDHGDPIPEGATQNTQAQDTQETANNGGAPAADISSLPVGDIATAIAQNTGLPANFIWAQLSHESDGGNSKLAREDHNYGGVKGNDGEYLHFDNDQQFIDYMSNYYPKYREDGIYDAQTADQFAEALQHGGYFTADLGEYEGGMHRYLEQAGLSDSGTAGAPTEKQSTVNTMTQQQFGDMLNEKMIDFAGTNDDTVKTVFNDMSTSKDKALVSLFAPYMQDGVFANTAANRTALVNNDGFKKAMAMFLSKHLSDYAPAFENGRISFQQAEDALRPRHQVQAAQTAQAPNIQTAASPKMEAAAIQNVLSSFAQDKKNVARTEQEANLFDDMLDADDHFIDTPKNRQTLLKNYGAQLQNYVDDVMTPSLDDRVNQAIEQAVQNKDLNRMNILTQAKQANDTATLEKLVGPQTKQHVDIAAMLTPANTDVKNHVSSMMQGNAPVHQTATMEHQAPQNEVASTVQGNTPVQQAPATENEMPQSKVASTVEANMPANQAPVRMDNQQAGQQDTPQKQDNVTPLPTQEAQQSEGVRIAQPQPTIDEQNAQMDARIAAIKKQPLAQRKALGQQYLDTLRQNNVSFSEKKLAKPLMDGEPEALEYAQRAHGDLLNTITPAEAAAASQHAPRTIQAATTARLANMVSEITSGNTYKNASPVGKLAYLAAASGHAKTVGADESVKAIDSIIADVRKKAGFSGKGTTEGMTPEQKDEFYNAFYKQSLDDATAIRKEAADEKPANLKSLDNTIEMFKQELANSKPTKEARKEVTHESTQSKNQQKSDEGTKNQDQHAEPEPRKTADTQREAEEGEVSTDRKAYIGGLRDKLKDSYNETLNETFEHNGKTVTRGGFIEDMVKRGEPLKSRQNEHPKYRIFSLDGHDLSPVEYSYYDYLTVKDKSTQELAKKTMLPGSADWITAHPFHYDKSKTVEENSAEATRIAKAYRNVFGETVAINTPERKALRRRIIEELYGKGAEKKESKAFIVIGLPASGKSSAVAEPLAKKYGALIIDSDEAKERLPEFTDGLLADAVHEESSKIAIAIRANAIGNGDNIVLPLVGRTESKLKDLISLLKTNGYEVNLHYVDLPVNKAVERGKSRFAETGRNVPLDYIRSVGLQPKHNFDKLKVDKEVDSYGEWSNDVDRGQRPRLLEERPTGLYSESELAGRRQRVLLRDGNVGEDSEQNQKAQGRGKDSADKVTSKENRSGKQDGFSVSESSPMGKPIHGRTGKETTVVTDSGKEIRVRYRLVPSYKVITSHDAETMTPNKAYPQELQPRDRQRVSMQEQVTTMANELRPADLGAGRNLNQGAPIISKDGVVLNGNGRAMAIQKATAAGGDKATAYRKYIFEHSKEFGISRSNLSQMRKYMLVREVVDDIDAETMQDIIGSTAGGSRMGASEQAKADAKKIKPRDLDSYVDNEQGDLTTAANQDFVARVLYRIVGKNERNAYTDEHGNVNADGIQRVKRALFSLAYNDDGLIDKMAESTDDNIRNVSRGLMSAAPAFARVNLAVKDGQAYEYDAGKTISDAVKHLDALRREGKPVKDYLNEQSMFSEYQDTDEVREVLRFFDENKRSGKRIGIFLNDMAKSILEQGSPNQTSLMDGGSATLGEIIKSAERVARDGTRAASLFDDKEESHVDVARSKASVQGDLKKIGKRVVFLPDNSLTSREKGIKEFGEKMGLKVVFFEGPSNLHGMYENGVSFINRSSSTSAPWTFWHETFHWLRHNNPELYRQMVSAIGKKQAFSSEQLQAYRDKTGRQALSDADVIEEMLADAMPDVHKRVSLFRDLGKADASLLQRFVGWLRDAMRAFHDALTGRKARLSEAQKAAMRDALANIAADLRDSNGKHIFKVNGAEREITAADGTKLSYPARFSGKQEAPTIFTAEDRLKADSKAWKGTLRNAWKGDMPDTTMLPVMQTPLVLKLVGAPDYPMVMRQSKLMKIKKDHPEMTKAVLNKLPEHLADPMIIFKSTTVPGRLVVGLDLKDTAGINVVVPIELNAKDGRLDVNVLTSAYGRGENGHTNVQYSWFWKNINEGNAIYVNKKQAADFYQSAGLQLPMEGRRFSDLFGSSIKTDADLVKSRRENPVRYSLDANDNSTPSLLTRAYNHLTGRKDAASHDKNVKAMLEDITKMRIRFGKLDPKTETVFKKFEGVIRARNANEWEKVLPEAGRAIADRLNLKPSEDMNNYIAKWLLDEATNDTSQEASDFAAALKNDPVLSDQLVDLKTLFNERNNREADEVVRDAIQYEKPKERTTLTKAWETFYDEMIEELGPVKRMVKRVQEKSGQELAASVNPYIALRLFRGNAGRAMTMIEGRSEAAVKALQTNYPGVNFEGFKTLHMILDECGALHNEKRMKDFLAFALACHVKDIHTLNNRLRKSQQHLQNRLDATDDINEREKIQAKIDKAEQSIMEVPHTEDGLELTEDRCNKVMMKYMKEYGEAQQDLVHFSKVTTSILYDAGVISKKRYKELQKRWPNYIPMFRVFEDNEEVDFGDSLKHMHGSSRRIINPLDSIIRNTYDFVKKAEKNKARQLLANLTRISDVGEYIEEVDNSKPNDKTTITFYEDGKRKYLQTDPDIVKAVNNMGRAETNLVLRLLHAPAKIARACFTTINPSFALRNLIRDATDASIYSKYGFKPWDFVRGFLHAVHQDELFYEWLSSGAAQASAISLDRDYTQATLNQMTKTWKERLLSKKFLPAILEGMQMVGEYSEYGTRIAVYERAKKKLAGENGPHPAAYDLASAALESRDTADFARGGRGSRYLNNVVIFANASIQGFDKFFRTFDFRKPYRKESMKALARLFLCGMLPALLLAGIHSGDDWWEELPDWQKETNWILGKVGNTIIRIPKGQDIGLRFFSNLIEKAMDRSKHKAGDYFKPVWDSLPDMIPTALLPIIEATANHSYFTGAPVVPKYQEKLPAYLQFGNETSSFAKFVGKVIGVSPRKVEHVLFGYTGNMGKGLLGVYDTIVGNQSLNTNLNEAPVISGFTAIPYKQSKTVNDFYDKFDEQQRLNEEFKLTKKKPDGYDPALYKRMTKAQQELSKINKQERAAIDDPKMDSGIREQKQLGYQQQRLSVVRRVMGQ
ncbi:LPD38 domain-containing protein [Mitsuokella multacida]|nr:LPD38 domain-containing protein [Mitsuokella multacida]